MNVQIVAESKDNVAVTNFRDTLKFENGRYQVARSVTMNENVYFFVKLSEHLKT